MTTYALVSDIHANLAALVRVLLKIRTLGCEKVGSLGDIIGYGPNPLECLRLIMKHASLSIVGNHDQAVRSGDWWKFNPVAADATEWTHQSIQAASDGSSLMAYLEALPTQGQMDSALMVHGSPFDPVEEYIFPADAENDRSKLERIFGAFDEPLCFVGHTHQPGVFLCQGGEYSFTPANRFPSGFTVPEGARAIVNVGSVGQPRDGDSRACFATYDSKVVRWYRVGYNWGNTQRRIRSNPALHEYLAQRLEFGK